jgi:hypothetical protein
MSTNDENNSSSLGPFPAGKNNIMDATNLPEGSLAEALDVDLTNPGNVISRPKFSKIYTGDGISSLYKDYFVERRQLKRLLEDSDGVFTSEIVNQFIQNDHVAYCDINDTIFYSDEYDVYSESNNHAKLGHTYPENINVVSTGAGSLVAGTYLISICFVNDITGEVYQASPLQTLTVANDSSVSISWLAHTSYSVNIYISQPNGEVLYLQKSVISSFNSANVSYVVNDTHAVPTLDKYPMPGGSILAAFDGRLYSAYGTVLWYSEPQWYSVCDRAHNFFQFAAPITIVQAVDSGLFVAADKTYFISTSGKAANSLNNLSIREVSAYKGIAGTGLTVDASKVSLEKRVEGKLAYWFSNNGGVFGLPDGSIYEISKDRLIVPDGLKCGTSYSTDNNELNKIVTSLQYYANASNLSNDDVSSDVATAKLYRNGVEIL